MSKLFVACLRFFGFVFFCFVLFYFVLFSFCFCLVYSCLASSRLVLSSSCTLSIQGKIGHKPAFHFSVSVLCCDVLLLSSSSSGGKDGVPTSLGAGGISA